MGSARRSIYVDSFSHKNPIPAAARKGNFLISGIITGLDPQTGKLAPTLEGQCALMFQQMRAIVEAGGGTIDDIVKMNVWLCDRSQRKPVNDEWVKMFPDVAKRPARQTMESPLDGGKLVQCDFIALIDD